MRETTATRDQLSLRLEPELPELPALPELRPMLARPLADPFDSADHVFEPSWGGLRALVYVGPASRAGSGEARIMTIDGRDVSAPLRELAGLAVRLDARAAILDGELVVVDAAGRADPVELDRRLAGESGRPVAFLAFDVLHVDGRSLLTWPLDRRRRELRRILRAGNEVVAVPAIGVEGRALHDAVRAQGIAGVMARQRGAPYLPGVRSRLWRFVPAAPADSAPVEPDASNEPSTSASAAGPVMALISRLPLPFDEEA
jgi:bifunctional non-homologous end joining protein LigD